MNVLKKMSGAARETTVRTRVWLAAESLCVLVGATLVIAVLVALGGANRDLRGDQEELNLIVEKRLHPEILPRDALYASPTIRLYTPSFLALQTTTSRWVGGDPVVALRILIWPFGVVFLVGHYVFFRSLTGNPVAAALGAISGLTVRNALGGEYWGFDGLRAIQPRSIVNGLTPLFLLLFLRWRERRYFPLYFFGLGVLLNIHPVGSFHLAQVTGAGHLWLDRFRLRAWRQITAGTLFFVAGALPLAFVIYGGREHVTDPGALAEVRAGLDYRFPYTFYPISAESLVSVTIHVALLVGAAAWLLWRRAAGTDLRQLLLLAAIAVLLGLGGTAIIQAVGLLSERPYIDILQMRAVKLAYPILLAALAALYAHLLSDASMRARIAVAGLFLLSLVPPEAVIHAASDEHRDAIKRALGIRVAVRVETAAAAPMPRALVEWTQASTPRDALFFTDLNDFRANARRSITGTYKDGGWLYLGGSRPFHAWYVYMREIDCCRAVAGRDCWFQLALRYHTDYVVVDPGVSHATPSADFVPAWVHGGWSVWQRQRVGPR